MVVGDIEDDDIFEKKSDEDEDVWVKQHILEIKSR